MAKARQRRELVALAGSARHEARHVAAALLLDVPVLEATALPRFDLEADELKDLGTSTSAPGRKPMRISETGR